MLVSSKFWIGVIVGVGIYWAMLRWGKAKMTGQQ